MTAKATRNVAEAAEPTQPTSRAASRSTTTSSRRPRLDASRIVEAALEIAQRQGTAALTVRRLGAELGVDATAMYRYFRSKDELLLMMADHLFVEVRKLSTPTSRWQDALLQGGRETVAIFTRYPAVGAVVASRTTRREGEFIAVEGLLGLMHDAGLNDEDAVIYYRTYADFLLSYSGMQAQYALLSPETQAADEASWAEDYATLPSGTYPNISRTAHLLAEVSNDDILDTGLRALIQAIAIRAAQT